MQYYTYNKVLFPDDFGQCFAFSGSGFVFFKTFRIRMVKKDRIRNTVGNKAYRLPGFPLIAFFR